VVGVNVKVFLSANEADRALMHNHPPCHYGNEAASFASKFAVKRASHFEHFLVTNLLLLLYFNVCRRVTDHHSLLCC